jgi:putative nucleotidyltransferase with HDIG domain
MKIRREKSPPAVQIKLSDVMGALSYALDLVEGQPEGHAARSCILGMRIGSEIGLPATQMSALFYALLMKDLGCSVNATRICSLFGADDRHTKRAIKTAHWTCLADRFRFAVRQVAPAGGWMRKARQLCGLAIGGDSAVRALVQGRCERGAKIARLVGLPNETASAIYALDEHFNGAGYPNGLAGDQIPLLGRILCLAQTAEVFLAEHGRESMREVLVQRKGEWFDPELTAVLMAIGDDDPIWKDLQADPRRAVAACEPADHILHADEDRLDQIATGFGQIIDAKSPWTYSHSKGVAEVSLGIGRVLGLGMEDLRDLRRAALLHDIGKLGVSNLILDKPGKLTAQELVIMRRHPEYTYHILKRVPGFCELADTAAAHHERLDGAGYHRGIDGSAMSPLARILAVADMYEALAARRPYRQDLSEEQVNSILEKHTGPGLCPDTVSALHTFVSRSGFTPFTLAA